MTEQLAKLLRDAAAVAVENGLDVDTFMRGAWTSYVEARPGMKEWLEEMQLRAQLDKMRAAGNVASA